MAHGRWQLVLPVKGGAAAKSRLGPAGSRRAALAEAVWRDCLDAALACPLVRTVLVVTGDGATGALAASAGAVTVRETRSGAGLPAAVADGLAATDAGPVAVLLGDLPALRPEDLSQALEAVEAALAGGHRSAFVPDAEGTGTVLLAGSGAPALRPAFGAASAAAHERGGAVRLALPVPRLRRDVDTPEALDEAVRLGVGRRTAQALQA